MFLPCKEHSAGAVIPRPPSPVTETLFRAGMALRLRSPSPKPLLIGQKLYRRSARPKILGPSLPHPKQCGGGKLRRPGAAPPASAPTCRAGVSLGKRWATVPGPGSRGGVQRFGSGRRQAGNSSVEGADYTWNRDGRIPGLRVLLRTRAILVESY